MSKAGFRGSRFQRHHTWPRESSVYYVKDKGNKVSVPAYLAEGGGDELGVGCAVLDTELLDQGHQVLLVPAQSREQTEPAAEVKRIRKYTNYAITGTASSGIRLQFYIIKYQLK